MNSLDKETRVVIVVSIATISLVIIGIISEYL